MNRRGWFIAVFVALQLLLPLTYYVARQDRYDERFAWRMFSDVRMVRCEALYTQNGRPVRLSERFHMAWINLMRRGRESVLEAAADTLCRDGRGPVTLRVHCREADGRMVTLHDGSRDLCQEAP